MIVVKKPSKKRDYFSAKVEHVNGDKVREILRGVKCLHVTQLSNGCTLLRIWLPTEDGADRFSEYDEDVCTATIQKNGEWFPNKLSEPQVRAYFQPSVHATYSTMIVMFHPWKPANIIVDGKMVDGYEALEKGWWTKEYHVSLEVEIESVCFYRQKFGIRWVVRRMWINTKADDTGEDWADRETIYADWREELDNFHHALEASREELRRKMERLDQFEEKMVNLWKDAGFVDDVEWNTRMEKLSKSLAKYQTGCSELEM